MQAADEKLVVNQCWPYTYNDYREPLYQKDTSLWAPLAF